MMIKYLHRISESSSSWCKLITMSIFLPSHVLMISLVLTLVIRVGQIIIRMSTVSLCASQKAPSNWLMMVRALTPCSRYNASCKCTRSLAGRNRAASSRTTQAWVAVSRYSMKIKTSRTICFCRLNSLICMPITISNSSSNTTKRAEAGSRATWCLEAAMRRQLCASHWWWRRLRVVRRRSSSSICLRVRATRIHLHLRTRWQPSRFLNPRVLSERKPRRSPCSQTRKINRYTALAIQCKAPTPPTTAVITLRPPQPVWDLPFAKAVRTARIAQIINAVQLLPVVSNLVLKW